MNNEVRKILKSRDIHPLGYKKIGNAYIIKDHNRSYVIKLNTNNYDIYKYLLSRDFTNYPENFTKKNDNYDIYEFIPEFKENKIQKIEDLITVLAILHKKTNYLREIDLDDINEIYENLKKKIDSTQNYYLKINDLCDKDLFLSPSKYLLIRNISLFYYALKNSNNYLDKWFNDIKKEKSIQVSLLHNNISIDHLIINDNKYLISWDKAYFDNPIYDLKALYQKYYCDIELSDMFKIYEKNNVLNNLEYNLLIAMLLVPEEIIFTNDTLLDTERINNEILYLKKIVEVVKNAKKKD